MAKVTATTRPRRRRNHLRVALVFLAPALVGCMVFYLMPAVRGRYLTAKYVGGGPDG